MNTSAWRRSSSATIGGWLEIVDTTVTRTPRRCTASTSEAEIAVAGEQYDLVDMLGKLHRIDRELDIHVALDLPMAVGVDEFLGRFGDDGVAVVVEPIEQRTN